MNRTENPKLIIVLRFFIDGDSLVMLESFLKGENSVFYHFMEDAWAQNYRTGNIYVKVNIT